MSEKSKDIASVPSRETRSRRVIIVAVAALIVLIAGYAIWAATALNDKQTAPQQEKGGTMQMVVPEGMQSRYTMYDTWWDAPKLTKLLGQTRSKALKIIGDGATVRKKSSTVEHGAQTLLTVALTELSSKDNATAPIVYLWMDSDGLVCAATYSCSMSSYGFSGSLTFCQALNKMHVVERALQQVDIEVQLGTATAPDDPAEYSTYRDDGSTLQEEYLEFSGTGTHDGETVNWMASLDYDYTPAIEKADNYYTDRILCIGVTR